MANNKSNEGNYAQPQIPCFNGHYDHWSILMENFLRSKEYWMLIEKGFGELGTKETLTDAEQKTLDELKLKDLQVKNYLFQAIDRTILETISVKESSKAIWEAMKKRYEGDARVKRATRNMLRKEFESLEMKLGEKVTDYVSRVMGVANKLRMHGETMLDVVIVEKILRSLTDRWEYVRCAIEESREFSRLKSRL